MTEYEIEDRRSSLRVPSSGSLRAHLSLEAEILSLSSRGMMVRLPFSPDVGGRFVFTLSMAGQGLDVHGVVRNSTAQHGDGGLWHDVGVEFVAMGAREHAALEEYVSRKLKPRS